MSYLKSKNGTPNNALYWTTNPLEPDVLRALQRIDETGKLRESERLNTAYLVALGCLEVNVDVEPMTFKITDKGYDALEFYNDDT